MKQVVLVLCMLVVAPLAFSKDRICCGEEFPIGGVLTSTSGRYFLVFQDDRNLVLYKKTSAGDKPLWATATNGRVNKCVMQADGNLVLYNNNTPVWASNTNGNANATLVVQNDGNLVIYAGERALWTSNTVQPPDDRICCGTEFPIGSVLTSANGMYFLVFQNDRNLVLYKKTSAGDKPLWATATNGRVNKCFMQADGNFVLYNNNVAGWASNTNGNSNASLVVQDDGNMVIYAAGNRALWATNTSQPVEQVVVPVVTPVVEVKAEPVVAGPCALADAQFNALVAAVNGQSFRDNKMSTAKNGVKNKCLSLEQVRGVAKLFSFEDQTLDFVKYAYDFTNEKSEYYTLADIFSFDSNVTKLNQFLSGK